MQRIADLPRTATQWNALITDAIGPDGWDVGRGELKNTRANDWTKLRDRMGYIVNLFRTQHLAADVVSSPYTEEQFQAIASGQLPSRPW